VEPARDAVEDPEAAKLELFGGRLGHQIGDSLPNGPADVRGR